MIYLFLRRNNLADGTRPREAVATLAAKRLYGNNAAWTVICSLTVCLRLRCS
jgi:hypothetical protein